MEKFTEPAFVNGKFVGNGKAPPVAVVAAEPDAPEVKGGDLDLSSFSKDELVAEANRRGVEVKPGDTKAEIIKALEAK